MRIFAVVIILLLSVSCRKDSQKTSPPVPNIKTQVVLVSPDTVLLLKDNRTQLTYTFDPPDTLYTRLLWTSSNDNIATVDGYGQVAAVGEGFATITATSERDSKVRGTAVVNVLKEYDVYYGGDEFFWAHGKYNVLPGGRLNYFGVKGITISGDDVYVAGYTGTINSWWIPTYWKNENPVQLMPDIDGERSYVKSVTVIDTVVYAAGHRSFMPGCPDNCGSWQTRAYCWKSTPSGVTEIPLFDSLTTHSDANGITTNLNGDALIAGNMSFPGNSGVATVWKNQFSEVVKFPGSAITSAATAIGRIGNDIYVAGVQGCPYTNCTDDAVLWKNNNSNVIPLSKPGAGGFPTGMFIKDQDIYISGYEFNYKGLRVAKIWKVSGNTVSTFDVTNGQTDAAAFSLYVIDDNIFICGFEDDLQRNRVPKYWRVVGNRSVEVVPYIPIHNALSINAIAVKK